MTLGKYIGGGMTTGAFGGRADIMAHFDPNRSDALPHGGTFNNNVVAMAAGCAAFDKLLQPQALNEMNARGDRMREHMNEAADRLGLPVRTTGLGAIFGIHFTAARCATATILTRPRLVAKKKSTH